MSLKKQIEKQIQKQTGKNQVKKLRKQIIEREKRGQIHGVDSPMKGWERVV